MKYGLHKKVYIINNFVIKIPKNFKDILSIINEQYGYITCHKKLKKYICPTYFIPLVPILIQPKLSICEDCNEYRKIQKISNFIIDKQIGRWELFTDIKPSNYGYFGKKIVKIDFGFNFYLYNFLIDIKIYLNNIYKFKWGK